MKLVLATAIVSLGVVLSPVAFAQGGDYPIQRTQIQQQTDPQHANTQRPDDSGYGMGNSGTSNASMAQTSRHAALMSHEDRSDLFAHH
ncbi:hypothetical protein [Paraburkholderia acidiphila]|uniref:DUF4148 domain-containing protein n=1 Tax=Paraburkholderia acidiphila TaxID=2571747 RepID=A0A7Z2GCP8_9BURK|nr:hypothetical protein [Paraburkholderia acidiphila]QGZ59397.1 hypothetical protein FAZ97_30825 [Paraburkholderia acidiphila]